MKLWALMSGILFLALGRGECLEPTTGNVIYGGLGGSLTTSEGTWTFGGRAPDGLNYYTELNGVANGVASELQIVSGNMYATNSVTGHWYLWQSDAWVDAGPAPAGASSTGGGSSGGTPASSAPSPDGSVIFGGLGGTLTTSEGTWSFGGRAPDGLNYYTELNAVANGVASELEIVSGNVYATNSVTGHWYLWQSDTWVDAGPAPAAASSSGGGSSGGTNSGGGGNRCGLTGLETILALGLLALRRRKA